MNERDKELAEQAGVFVGDFAGAGLYLIHNKEEVEKFASAVRADEREACAKVCEQPIDEIQITATISEVVYMDAHECAAGIRARGNNVSSA